jgi:hypothetical protein
MKSFQELEVRHVWFDYEAEHNQNRYSPASTLARLFQILPSFKGLKRIVIAVNYEPAYISTLHELQDMRNVIEKWLVENKNEFNGGVAPVVTVRMYQDLYTGEKAFG